MEGGGGKTTGVLGGVAGARAAPPVPWQYAGLAARPSTRASARTCKYHTRMS